MRRAQAAMEYLITYGWAVLIMLVVVGVLFYLGIFNPRTIAACSFQTPGFTCYAYKIASFAGNTTTNTSGLILDLGQATGHDIKILGINCTAMESWTVTDFNASGYPANMPVSINNSIVSTGSHKMINGTSTTPSTIPCYKLDGSMLVTSDVLSYYKGKIYIHYVDTDTNFDHKVIGDLSGKIE